MSDLAGLFAVDPRAEEAVLIEQIAGLERLKSAAAAGQARAAAALDERRRADEAAAGVPARQRGRGVASEVALARRDSPARAVGIWGLAKALVHEMPHTLAALEVQLRQGIPGLAGDGRGARSTRPASTYQTPRIDMK